ncbi:MAG: hypothetical protein JXA60_09990 [Candidatus Coatesbacteria bacterium]|nr:hypothetical protein [Candidatus Coatesbacteria bacterium]
MEEKNAGEQASKKESNPLLACIMSCIVAGLGQIYNRQIAFGIIIFVTFYGTCLIAFLLYKKQTWGLVVLCLVMLSIWIFSAINAYQDAKKSKSNN